MRALVLGCVVLLASAAGAISRDDFAAFTKRATGLSSAFLESKRACVCRGGGEALNGYLGVAVATPEGARQLLECVVPRFADDGHELDEAPCSAAGGTVELLGK